MDITLGEILRIVIELVAVVFGGGRYLINRMDKMQEGYRAEMRAEIKKTDDAVQRLGVTVKETSDSILKQEADDTKYLHEHFVTKETYLHVMGGLNARLDGIFKKIDELTKAVARQQGLDEGREN